MKIFHKMTTKLSVNINKIATIRNARGGKTPNVVQIAKDCELFGADGITVHPRPDERHITHQDVLDLSQVVKTEFNIEGYPDERFMKMIRDFRPAQATLVPDAPDAITSNAGWDTEKHFDFLQKTVQEIKALGVRTSLFMETSQKHIELAKNIGTDRIEFYTGPYADNYDLDREKAIEPFRICSKYADELGLGINAGHDLSLENLAFFKANMHNLLEVSIGHALISDALYYGLENTIMMYKKLLS